MYTEEDVVADALELQPLVRPGWDDWDVDRGHPVQLAHPPDVAAAVPPGPQVRFLDVSHWQGAIDMEQVKAAGYVAVVAKLTEGTGFVDSRGRENMRRAEAAGLVAGGYHFLRRDASATAQFTHFLEQLQPAAGRLVAGRVVMLDAETAGNGTDPTIDQADEWSDLCHRELGILPWQYYPRWWLRKVGGCPTVRGPWWQSAFGPDPGPLICGYARIAAWQYTSTGRVPGVAGNVDLNRWFGDLASLKATTVGGSEEDMPLSPDDLKAIGGVVDQQVLELLRAGFGGLVPGSQNATVRASQGYLFGQVAAQASRLTAVEADLVKLVGAAQQIVDLLERIQGADPVTVAKAAIDELSARTAPRPDA